MSHQANMSVDSLNATVRAGDKEFRVDELFNSEDDTILDLEADSSPVHAIEGQQIASKKSKYPEFSTALLAYST
jgi:hypothetical protein